MTDSAAPDGWQLEVPRWRATRALRPSPNPRHRFESPFSTIFENDVWQHQTQPSIAAGDEFESREWPHSSLFPLNESAHRVLSYFNSRMKSRLGRSPFRGDRIDLDDGLAGPTEPRVSRVTAA